MQKNTNDIVIFLIVATAIILCMIAFILFMLVAYRKSQTRFTRYLEQIKLDNERTILSTRLEIQEQTFQNISREIHDNITLSLTLAKLHLHTLDWDEKGKFFEKVTMSIELLTQSISELSDISKTLNADVIIQNGLLKALEDELNRIRQADLFDIEYEIAGTPIYMDSQKELIIFRIVQEAFNNIIKHSEAKHTKLTLDYDIEQLNIIICDDGKGFDSEHDDSKRRAGLKNMDTRIKILKGKMYINSQKNNGSTLTFNIPLI